ncbi:pseudouridine synthase [Stereum hirsutum FP-91666 SS1]|uniref:pseudouridine synthase n=1 Tax=Stereum hirsutum (strain FP-91666) TaxID=721885 RepID=UPI000444925E|nr:pseudouridine synthase [Stereum hirsutum FP-91666 SS1]EIM80852.1 pseudouridine synthase [Stereum hirsutum FP-91666 SS1]
MAPDPLPLPATRPGLKKIAPYWYPYTTMAKGRWFDREILEVVSTEFRDRSVEYYRYALESGVTTVNGKIARPGTILRNGDRLENIVHRHEPPVTSTPVQILHTDYEREFIVINKPGSIPVHATGRFFYLSLVEILQREFGFKKVYTVNRLDRLTSGIMVVGLSSKRAHTLSEEFTAGQVKKEYIARCKGEFPEGETYVDQPMLTVDRQMGLNIIHPEGKTAQTIFTRLHYDANTDTSVLHCRPLTGRSHQIRVHLQYLGHPVANDPIYSETKIWGPNLGKGGIDINPSDERSAPAPPPQFQTTNAPNPEQLSRSPKTQSIDPWYPSHENDLSAVDPSSSKVASDEKVEGGEPVSLGAKYQTQPVEVKPLPRETGHDIGMGSPVPLSAEAVNVITKLRNMKDEDEDWSRWRDVVFKAKGKLHPSGLKIKPLQPQSKRKRGGPGWVDGAPPPVEVAQESGTATPEVVADQNDGMLYCPECYLPLHPDPKPERLYIFLHALRYTTSLGVFETGMPEWAEEGWEWERDE